MSNYNNDILEIIPEFMQRMVSDLNKTNDNKIQDLDVKVSGTEDTSVSNYMTKEVDSYFKFDFTYKFEDKVFQVTLIVPKEVSGVFIVGGKLRVPYNELVTDFRMKYHKGRVKIDRSREAYINKNGSWILQYKDMEYNLSNRESYSQIPTEVLQLDDELKKLAKAKVFYEPEFIDVNLCNEIYKYGEANGKFSNLADITITSTAEYVRKRLNRDYFKFMNPIRYKFKGGNKFTPGLIYVNDINKSIQKYFSISEGNFNYFNNVTNPLTLQSLSTQVKVPYGNSLNPSIFDVIDVVDTPINNNINKINYLNRNIKLEGDSIKIQVYNKNKERVWLDKLDYCSSNILISDAFDYKTWSVDREVLSSEELPVKLGGIITTVSSFDEVDYIELDPNDRTSITSHVVPMINKSELGRMAMGTSMIKQGVTLINADDPRVTTTDLTELVKLNPLIITAEGDGVVESVTRNVVKVKYNDGLIKEYKVPYALKSYQDNLVPFMPVVSASQVVHKGDIIISPSNVSKNSVKYGINAIAAFNPYFGYNSDDAVVISESFAEKLASMYSKSQVISVKNINSIKFLAKSGTKLNSGDILMSFTIPTKSSKYGELLDTNVMTESNLLHRVAMNNLIDAYIYEINIAIGSKVNLDDESYQLIDGVNKDVDLSEITDSIPLTPSKDLHPSDNEFLAEIKFLMKRKAVVGDKLSNRYGNKGEIAKIVPDKDMIQTESGLVADICFSRESLPARKNISQIFELYLGQISMRIEELWNSGDKAIATGVYNTLFKTSYSTEEFEDKVKSEGRVAFSAKVNSYSKLTADEVIKALDELKLDINQPALIKGRKLSNKVLFGPMYIIKLPYLPENTLSVTASDKLVGIRDPVLGLGKVRTEGQKLGEMESTALAVNSPKLLEYYKSIAGVNSNINRLYFDFLDLGLDIEGIASKASEKINEPSQDSIEALVNKYK